MKKFLCRLFGHRWRCLMRRNNMHEDGWHGSAMSGWYCDRCEHMDWQQWDF